MVGAGIRRIVDLRNPDEVRSPPGRPDGIEVVRAPLEDPADPDYTALWNRNWAHPDFYAWGIRRWPELWDAAFGAIADAPQGGVLIHCAGGRDRTGMLSAILLELAGVDRAAVLAGYADGMHGTNEMLRRQGRPEHEAGIAVEELDGIVATYSAALDSMLDDLPMLLEQGGLTEVAGRSASRLI